MTAPSGVRASVPAMETDLGGVCSWTGLSPYRDYVNKMVNQVKSESRVYRGILVHGAHEL
jgi:hypothetical protein